MNINVQMEMVVALTQTETILLMPMTVSSLINLSLRTNNNIVQIVGVTVETIQTLITLLKNHIVQLSVIPEINIHP